MPENPSNVSETARDELVPLADAGAFFPKNLCRKSLLRRVNRGVRGVRLRADYDGYRYWTRRSWVEEFLQAVAETRRKPPMSAETEEDRKRAMTLKECSRRGMELIRSL